MQSRISRFIVLSWPPHLPILLKNIFKKLGHRFLAESTVIENALFPCKTAISEADVKTNRMVSTK